MAGGGDFYMAAEADAYVHGVDLSVNMVLIALERASAARNGFKVHSREQCDRGVQDCMLKLSLQKMDVHHLPDIGAPLPACARQVLP